MIEPHSQAKVNTRHSDIAKSTGPLRGWVERKGRMSLTDR